ncbi:MAG: ABC transporter permease [Ignavibacteriaceae bacterium]|nr:MAG: ABC transporter permease [Chlorobiota bacterium]KXK06062.1 MAG: Lipoprotein-releasing system permease protein [Chlorobi bacterium OLB4]MBV6398497.1 Lipoprotein-releasing system transmembrane protein LolE [Ignavibacteria bacterium]MCC6885731.1 ABC transporter permease [Ignavibacteriales bacterium]MCE7953074.1 ABC transporter permease [Chlorobi bacterium CHB7]MDL1887088.1 ABC transporter permease [Ignavibacteria bacterium CHB1]MEB2329143.1 ABC transporter permease [Ignavibacteriaceae ba
MKLENFIARRYLFSKRKINFITIITGISVIGVTIGVAAMIIVLSVFNGFNQKVTSILVNFDPHLRIESANGELLTDYHSIQQKLDKAGYSRSSPFTLTKGMVSSEQLNKVLYVKGVDAQTVDKVSGIKDVVVLGEFDLKNTGEVGGIVIGRPIAGELRALTGDTITLLSPVGLEHSLTQFVKPVTKRFVVRGIFDSDNKEYDSKYAYISLENAAELFELGDGVQGVEIRLNDINESDDAKEKLKEIFGNNFKIMTWYDLHKDFYSILKIERLVAFIILSIIILVASFNILASLTMTVIEKKRDIGVLKSMGATDKTITKIFLTEGVAVGLIGMIAGSIIGLAVTLAQKYFEFYRIDSSVYKFDALPVELRYTDFIFVPLAAFVLCFLASLYPSRKAAKQNPVESIRWE